IAGVGFKTLDVLDNRVGRLKEIKGIGKKAIQRIHDSWEEQKAQSNALIFLQGHGIPMGTAMKIHGKYGAKTMEVVEQHPYRLAIDIAG
ncbi:helix-hairpin-helix domain-containing protein, partial [Streptococcus pneumoniae]|uniref:helix-hairpin-helix domain-containing protein n=1 Tax=Streptococcus pneumoniae TaxID=1313 RepID=UPI001E3F308A